jgi:hypothetical protein
MLMSPKGLERNMIANRRRGLRARAHFIIQLLRQYFKVFLRRLRRPRRSSVIDHFPAKYIRRRAVVVSRQQTTDADRHDYTEVGIPHKFAEDGEAEDLPVENPTSTAHSLCSAGNFLYLLTPPLQCHKRQPVKTITGNVNFGIVMTQEVFQRLSKHTERDNLMPYFEVAWVRASPGPQPALVEASERFVVAQFRFPEKWSTSVPYSLDINLQSHHPIIQQAKNGDMLGLWIQSPAPNYVFQTCLLSAYWALYLV